MFESIVNFFKEAPDPRINTLEQMFDEIAVDRSKAINWMCSADESVKHRVWKALSHELNITYHTAGILAYTPNKHEETIKTALKATQFASNYRVQLALLHLRTGVDSESEYACLLYEAQTQFPRLRINPQETSIYWQILQIDKKPLEALHDLDQLAAWYDKSQNQAIALTLHKIPLTKQPPAAQRQAVPNNCSMMAWQVHQAFMARTANIAAEVEEEADFQFARTFTATSSNTLLKAPEHSINSDINNKKDPRTCSLFKNIFTLLCGGA